MARAGRKDRGLLSKLDSTSKPVWFVQLYHEGQERRFGSLLNKTKTRDFFEKAKLEQKEDRFFPERYQHGGYELVAGCPPEPHPFESGGGKCGKIWEACRRKDTRTGSRHET